MNIYIYTHKSQSNIPNTLQLYKTSFLIGYNSICKIDICYNMHISEIFKKKSTWSNGVCRSGGDREGGSSSKISLLGLQSPRTWFGKFNQAVETLRMQSSKSRHSIFYKNSNSSIILLVCMWIILSSLGVTPKVYYLLNPFCEMREEKNTFLLLNE